MLIASSNRSVGHDVSYPVQGEIRDAASIVSGKGPLDPDRIQYCCQLDYSPSVYGRFAIGWWAIAANMGSLGWLGRFSLMKEVSGRVSSSSVLHDVSPWYVDRRMA